MRRPDAAAGGDRVQRHPLQPRSALRGSRPMKQADGHRARQQADQAGERNQPQIMLVAEAIQDLVHDRPLSRAVTTMAMVAFAVTAAASLCGW